MRSPGEAERLQAVVIGGGQSGLAVGYHLARRGIEFVILDANARIGDSWRKRWDSLRLFSTAAYDSIPGLRFPAPKRSFPTKEEMADYLEAYAAHFDLPVRTGVRVDRVWKESGRYFVSAGDLLFETDNVVIAMSSYQEPRIPAFAAALDPQVMQLHSRDYRNLGQLRDGDVLVVGAGNSGAEIAIEAARAGRRTWLSGRPTGHVPFDVDSVLARYVVMPLLFRIIFHRLLTVDTPIGRKARPNAISRGTPLIRQRPKDLAAAGVQRVGRTSAVRAGKPVLEDGRVLDVSNVIWSTGYAPTFSWIDLPVFDRAGEPMHERGIMPHEPGLSFVGLHFLYAMSSTMIQGVGRDAERIANHVAARTDRSSAREPRGTILAGSR